MFQVTRLNGGESSSRAIRWSRVCACAEKEIAPLIESDARISFRIEHIGDKVYEHKDHGHEEDAALHGRQIAPLDGHQHVAAHARPGKYRFSQNTARQIIADIETKHGDDR